MSRSVRAGVVVVGLAMASVAQAGCSVSADQGASARRLSPTVQADANLVISMSMVPKLTHLNYQAASHRPDCDLGPLAAGDAAYELWGSDAERRERKALPTKKGQPIALVIPVFDMLKAIDSAKTDKAVPMEGYLLATITKAELTGWRFYTNMPDVAVLKHDMTEALSGGGTPIFRNGPDNKTDVFVPTN